MTITALAHAITRAAVFCKRYSVANVVTVATAFGIVFAYSGVLTLVLAAGVLLAAVLNFSAGWMDGWEDGFANSEMVKNALIVSRLHAAQTAEEEE